MIDTRPEQPADTDVIRELVRLAFTGHPVSGGTEPLIIDALREDGALELSLVAELDGAVVGHIAYSAAGIGDASSRWFLVGPLAVLPEHQGHGIARALMEASLDIMRSRRAWLRSGRRSGVLQTIRLHAACGGHVAPYPG